MGDRDDDQVRRRRGRRAVGTLGVTAALLVGGAYVQSQVPEATPLAQVLPGTVASSADLDAQASALTDRLSTASGRTFDSLVEGSSDAETGPTEAAGGTGPDAEELTDAEAKAAEALVGTPEERAAAEAQRKKKEQQELEAEDAAEAELDAAIDAAIAAAQSQDTGSLPAPAAAGGTTPTGASTSTEQVLGYVRQSFPADQVGNAMAVARCESGHANRVGRTNANGTTDYGVFQLNDGGTLQAALSRIGEGTDSVAEAREKAMDAEINVRAAAAIWKSRGWQPWVCAAKLKIVSGLYQRSPGPMDGRYDEYGRAE